MSAMDAAVTRSRGRLVAALAVAALALAGLAPAASAGTAAAAEPEAAAALASALALDTAPASKMAIEFTSATARVVGPGAVVRVRCTGVGARGCVGTLAINAPGEPPEVPYSIDRGRQQALVVPLGEQRSIFAGMVAVRSRVVARTVQSSGGSIRTARVLRFK